MTASSSLSDLRARVIAGDVLTDEEILHAVRSLRDQRAKAVQRAAAKAQNKHVDMDALFAGTTPGSMTKDPFR